MSIVIPENDWSRDVALMLIGWLAGTVVAIVLLFTLVRWLFV